MTIFLHLQKPALPVPQTAVPAPVISYEHGTVLLGFGIRSYTYLYESAPCAPNLCHLITAICGFEPDGIEGKQACLGSCAAVCKLCNGSSIAITITINYTVDLGHPLLKCNAGRRVCLPTIVSAKPCSCLYFVLVTFLNRNAAAKRAFEKADRQRTPLQFRFSSHVPRSPHLSKACIVTSESLCNFQKHWKHL